MGALMMMSKNKLPPAEFSWLSRDISGADDNMRKAAFLLAIPGSMGTTADIFHAGFESDVEHNANKS